MKLKKEDNSVKIPTLKFNSEYFKCPVCGWATPLRVLGDSAPNSRCEECRHVGLYRVK